MIMVNIMCLFLLILFDVIMAHDDSNTKLYMNLVKWGQKNNVTLNEKLDLEFINFNKRHYVAKEPIKEGEILLIVPGDMFLTSEKVMQLLPKKFKSVMKRFIDKWFDDKNGLEGISSSTKEQSVITYSIFRGISSEKGKFFSTFKPFIEMFEENVDNYPVLYTKEEFSILENTDIGSKVFRSKKALEEEAILFQSFFNRTIIIEEYLRYRVLIAAKSYFFNNRSNIVPFADLFDVNPFNHSAIWNYSESKNTFEIKATRDILKGERIDVATPMSPNSKYLLFYGKTFDNNHYVEPYEILYTHPKWKQEANITMDIFDKRFDLATDGFIGNSFETYKILASYLHMPNTDDTGYKLIRINLGYYLDDYNLIEEKDYYNKIMSKENRINIIRVIEIEKRLLMTRIKLLDEIIEDREKRNKEARTDL